VSLADLKSWARDGRVDANTRVSRSDLMTWGPAGELPELEIGRQAPPPAPARAMAAAPRAASADSVNDPTVRNAAGWFFWIAGLSVVNSLALHSGAGFGFPVGLGATYFASGIVKAAGGSSAVAVVIDLLVCLPFFFLGRFAMRGQRWAFLTGIGLYIADALLFLLIQDWLSLGFHVYVLWHLFRGLKALNELRG
jgi:hypothetical protein